MSDVTAHWESRYSEREHIWSGRPNHAMVTAVGPLPPGRALDLGCGEGADSVWLAEHRWQVTAVDVAPTAVARARDLAAERQVPADRITWQVEDLVDWTPKDRYDLVSACFLHSSIPFARTEVLRRAAAAVAPSGHLLVVGHAAPPPWAAHGRDGRGGHAGHDTHAGRGTHRGDDTRGASGGHGGYDHEFLGPAEEVASLRLDHRVWEVVVSELRPRAATGPDGEQAQLEDVVVLARRTGDPRSATA